MIYKQLSEEMREGLKNIYQQISSASAESRGADMKTSALITEASSQLDEVVKATESAAMNIMSIVEKQSELAEKSEKLLRSLKENLADNKLVDQLLSINGELSRDLTEVLTALSFQDIAGQRIKKVMTALEAIEKSVVDLYLSSGLVMSAAEKDPDCEAEAAQAEAQKAIDDYHKKSGGSELKGPDKNAPSQEAIDAMLSQLGL